LIAEADNAAEAWSELENLYRQRSHANALRLKREMASLEKKRDENITQYVARAKSVADQLRAAGFPPDEADMIQTILAGLPSKFAMVKSIIENMDELPTLNDVTARLMLVESDRSRGNESAYFGNSSGSSSSGIRPPFNNNRPRVYVPPHRRSGRPAGNQNYNHHHHNSGSSSRAQEKRTCYYCGKKGHLKKDCRKRKADQERNGHLFRPYYPLITQHPSASCWWQYVDRNVWLC